MTQPSLFRVTFNVTSNVLNIAQILQVALNLRGRSYWKNENM